MSCISHSLSQGMMAKLKNTRLKQYGVSVVYITRSTVRKSWDFRNIDIEIENTEGAIN